MFVLLRNDYPSLYPSLVDSWTVPTIIRFPFHFFTLPSYRPPLQLLLLPLNRSFRPSQVLRLVSYLGENIVRGVPGSVNRSTHPLGQENKRIRVVLCPSPASDVQKRSYNKSELFITIAISVLLQTLFQIFVKLVQKTRRLHESKIPR